MRRFVTKLLQAAVRDALIWGVHYGGYVLGGAHMADYASLIRPTWFRAYPRTVAVARRADWDAGVVEDIRRAD